MTIRSATADDAAAVVSLVNRAAREDATLGIDAFPLSAAQEAVFVTTADPSVHLFLVAEDQGSLAGHLYASRGVSDKSRHTGSLAIVVAPSHRRRGIGEALMMGCLRWARAAGVRKMTLSVLATNRGARRLFAKMGFVDEAVRRGQFSVEGRDVDEVMMALWIDGGETS